MRFRCPQCHKNDGLWEEITISGWHELNERLEPQHRREADWVLVEREGQGGCSRCGWEGMLKRLEQVGIDNEPLPDIHPEQQQIEAA